MEENKEIKNEPTADTINKTLKIKFILLNIAMFFCLVAVVMDLVALFVALNEANLVYRICNIVFGAIAIFIASFAYSKEDRKLKLDTIACIVMSLAVIIFAAIELAM